MKAIFLIITVVLIGAPFLILSVNASQFNGTCPNNHGGMINDTGGFSCVTTTHGNTTAGVFLHISGPHDLQGAPLCTSINDCYKRGFDAGMKAHGLPCPFINITTITNLTLLTDYCHGFADGDAVGN